LETKRYQDILRFWFPDTLKGDRAAMVRQWQWWFCGGANAVITAHFAPMVELAKQGGLDAWSLQPQSRLALIIILDQFSRSLYQGTPQAFSQDAKACAIALEGIDIGHYALLQTPWEKTFFILPLGHSERIEYLELVVKLADDLVLASSPEDRELLEFSAAQVRRHREVVHKFGRHPHRNEILGRKSTSEELEYLSGQLVHRHPLPPHLEHLISNT
jgi:uncharacterized protein (DUF924 family)